MHICLVRQTACRVESGSMALRPTKHGRLVSRAYPLVCAGVGSRPTTKITVQISHHGLETARFNRYYPLHESARYSASL